MALTFAEKEKMFNLQVKAILDTRVTACRVKLTKTGNAITLQGYTHYRQTTTLVKNLAEELFGKGAVDFKIKTLHAGAPRFAVAVAPAVNIWLNPDTTNPDHLDTQALLGTVLRTYHREGAFTFVQHPEGYVGYAPTKELKPVTDKEYLRWKNGPYAIATGPVAHGDIIVPMGARLPRQGSFTILPDGKRIKISADKFQTGNPADPVYIKALRQSAQRYFGQKTPYLWGGKSEVGIDCSGFVQTLNRLQGIVLPRDASMQCHIGEMVGYLPDHADLLPGDILFFMRDTGKVYHVGIYLGKSTYMHSAGATGPTISSLHKTGKNFFQRYHNSLVYARRVKI